MPPKSPCPNILSEGTCQLEGCKHDHDIYICTDCRTVCFSTAEHTSHLESQKHQEVTSPFLKSGKCRACGFKVPSQWRNSHLSSLHHYEKVLARAAQKDRDRTTSSAKLRPYYVDCGVCESSMHHSKWFEHVSSPEHASRAQFASLHSAIGKSEQNKHGVVVSPSSVDFGLLDIDSLNARAGPSISLSVTVTSGDHDITLADARLLSSCEHTTASPFSLLIAAAEDFSPIHPYHFSQQHKNLTITITVLPRTQIGQFRDRLEFTFSRVVGTKSERFVITRPLCAAVGVNADYDLLKPKAPYVPLNRKLYLDQEKVIPGIRPPPLEQVTVKLGTLLQWEVPAALVQVLKTGGKTSAVLKALKEQFLPSALTKDTYKQWFHVFLYLEEEQAHLDIQRYNEDDGILEPKLPFFHLQVPGLSENRPSLIMGDRVLVRRQEYRKGLWYEGYVHKIYAKEVKLRFNNSFHGYKGQGYSIRFQVNRGPFRRMHQAIEEDFEPERLIFPALKHILGRMPPSSRALEELRPFNRDVTNNESQKLAVAGILGQSAGSVPFLIFGPPGTGKTATIVETIRQLISRSDTRRILACAPSNSAADVIAERLMPLGTAQLLRLVAPSRNPEVHSQLLTDGRFVLLDAEGHFKLPLLEDLLKYRVIVCTCVSSFWPRALGLERGYFSHIFVDEAGQAYEPEAIIPIKVFAGNATSIVLSGDPRQLGPIVRSNPARKLGMAESYLERLMARDPYQFPTKNEGRTSKDDQTPRIDCTGITIAGLDKNFRSHPLIIQFSSEQFYGGRLQACARPEITHSLLRSHLILSPGFPVVFKSLTGKDLRESNSPSFFNIEEVSEIKRYIKALKGDRRLRLTDKDFGVISPYHAQCKKIGYAIKNIAPDIKVGSVEEFQGQERRIILISTVRSNLDFIEHDVKHALGFVANARRFNVAVTRAQALLILVGDSKVLALDPLWRAFLSYVHVQGGWTGNPITWDPNENYDSKDINGWNARLRGERDITVRRAMEIINSNTEVLGDTNEAEDWDANIDRPWREEE